MQARRRSQRVRDHPLFVDLAAFGGFHEFAIAPRKAVQSMPVLSLPKRTGTSFRSGAT
jgi:hypothetical protein